MVKNNGERKDREKKERKKERKKEKRKKKQKVTNNDQAVYKCQT